MSYTENRHGLLFPSLLQGHRQEVIGSLKDVVQDMLKEFYRRNNARKPEAIIYYRDGVADSQFPTVLEYEYTAFRQVTTFAGGRLLLQSG